MHDPNVGFYGFASAPFILAMALGPINETSLRQSLLISRGSFGIFLTSPICAVLIGLTAAFLVWPQMRLKGGKV